MRFIALTLFLIFTTFNLLLFSYYLWQDEESITVVLVEEEDNHSAVKSVKTILYPSISHFEEFELTEITKVFEFSLPEKVYDDVLLQAVYSPPDVILYS